MLPVWSAQCKTRPYVRSIMLKDTPFHFLIQRKNDPFSSKRYLCAFSTCFSFLFTYVGQKEALLLYKYFRAGMGLFFLKLRTLEDRKSIPLLCVLQNNDAYSLYVKLHSVVSV